LATTKEAVAKFSNMQRMRSKKDTNGTNWLRCGIPAIVFLLGCVIVSERSKSLSVMWQRCRGSQKGVDGTDLASTAKTEADSDQGRDLECPTDATTSLGESALCFTRPTDLGIMAAPSCARTEQDSTSFNGILTTMNEAAQVQDCLEFAVPSVHPTDFLVHACLDARYLDPQELPVLRGASVPTRFSE
jgi:hypothetical protein